MKGTVSFHPVELAFFESTILPLLAGEKVNPELYVSRALKLHATAVLARGYLDTLERLIEESQPPPPPPGASHWTRLRTWMERIDYRADPLARKAARVVSPDLHLHGRPFLVTEGSAESVAATVERYIEADLPAVPALVIEQLGHLDAGLASELTPEVNDPSAAGAMGRAELLAALEQVHALARAAREGGTWSGAGGPAEPAATALPRELPWRVALAHSRGMPYWIARDVDGLETVCRAAGVPPPDFLVPAWGLFGPVCEMFPALREALDGDLRTDHDVGAFVAPDAVPALLDFLSDHGARIIQAATRHGEGSAGALFLRKLRECATFARRRGLGYLEVSGIGPMGEPLDEAATG